MLVVVCACVLECSSHLVLWSTWYGGVYQGIYDRATKVPRVASQLNRENGLHIRTYLLLLGSAVATPRHLIRNRLIRKKSRVRFDGK